MKSYSLIAALLLTGCVTGSRPPSSKIDAIQRSIQSADLSNAHGYFYYLPAAKAETHPRMFYNLFARTSFEAPPIYGIQIATPFKLDVTNATVRLAGSDPLEITGRSRVRYMSFRPMVNQLEAIFPGNYAELAATAGGRIQIVTGNTNVIEFTIPNWLFSAIRELAGDRSPTWQSEYGIKFPSESELIKDQRDQIRHIHIEGHPELTDEIRNAILQGRIIAGMTKDDVFACIGRPIYTTAKDYLGEDAEYWSYFGLRVYFQEDRVIRCDP